MFDQNKSPRPATASSLQEAGNTDTSSKASVISSDLTITGSIDSEGSVTVEGKITGDVNCKSVLVQKSGVVEGSLTAEDIDIYGTVDGTITGDRVSIRETSKVEADIHHNLIELEMGTEFSGVLKRKDKKEDSSSVSSTSSYGSGLTNGQS